MPETIQSVLANFFEHEAAWRLRKYQMDGGDPRQKCSAAWFRALATFVSQLTNNDPGIQALEAFGWPARCFSRGTGAESNLALRSVGIKGSRNDPVVVYPSSGDLEKIWKA
jgi:hypothetical protein